MFIRRKKKSALKKIKDFIWPSIGLKRSFKYTSHRLGRIPASSYEIACGFACGAAVSFTPFIGLHFIIASIIAVVVRASVIASAIGTIVGNPLTFPFIWALTYKTGDYILGGAGTSSVGKMFSGTIQLFGQMNHWYFLLVTDPSIAMDSIDEYILLWQKVWIIIYPLLIGSIPWFVIVWVFTVIVLYPIITKYKQHRSVIRKNPKKLEKKIKF